MKRQHHIFVLLGIIALNFIPIIIYLIKYSITKSVFYDFTLLFLYISITIYISALVVNYSIRDKWNKRDSLFIFEFHRYSSLHFWISLFWSFVFTGIFSLIITSCFESELINYWQYIIGIFFSFLLGLWGILITFVVLKQQKQDFIGIENFLKDVISLIDEWQTQDERSNNSKRVKDLFIVGFHPLIGLISIHKEDIFSRYRRIIESLASHQNVNVRIICSTDDDIERLIDNLYKNEEEKIEILKINKEFFDKIEKPTSTGTYKDNLTIWRTNTLNALHFFAIDNVVYQFSVVSNPHKGIHELLGIRTEDVFIVDFLKKTFDEIESKIVTPLASHTDTNSDIFLFENQKHVKTVTIYDLLTREEIHSKDCVGDDFEILKISKSDVSIANNSLLLFEFVSHHKKVINQKLDYIISQQSKPFLYKF